jgi:2'-hydroxyisoflavone reductase
VRVLVIGGTVFLGRHLVDAALERGHEVTLFHRGRHAAHRPGEVEEVLGDRACDLGLLAGRQFDAVVDTCGYLPRHVGEAASALRTDHYTFVSSASVYADLATVPVTETNRVHAPPGPEQTAVDGQWYGPQKAGCERALAVARSGPALVQRVGLIGGPHDPTDRLTYWVTRMRRPGPVLAPAVPDQPVQFIDARDLAAWTLDAAAAGTTGTMNVNGPRGLTFGRLLAACGDAEIAWTDEDVLLEQGVAPWTELPLWVPERFGLAGMSDMDTGRAPAAGLRTRPVEETIAAIAAWAESDAVRVQADYGTRARSAVLTPEREAELLER